MVLLKSRMGIPARLENRLCLSPRSERVSKRHLLLATLVGMVMIGFVPCASADLYVLSESSNGVLRYSEVTGNCCGICFD
jgi:hypothetical protein